MEISEEILLLNFNINIPIVWPLVIWININFIDCLLTQKDRAILLLVQIIES